MPRSVRIEDAEARPIARVPLPFGLQQVESQPLQGDHLRLTGEADHLVEHPVGVHEMYQRDEQDQRRQMWNDDVAQALPAVMRRRPWRRQT